MVIQSIQEANEALLPYVPLVAQLTGKDTVLDRIIPLMELLGNPQDHLKVIHIAGTSGKTSTAYYIAALLTASSQKVGLTVSPHIDSVTERVQLNGMPIEGALFCSELGTFLETVEQLEHKPSYFELLYAFSLWVFARQKVDYAVVETGMGGLYDATNVVTRKDKLCIITDIGLDHTHILGSTLAQIAAQKIGIVHEGNSTLTYRQTPEVMAVFDAWTEQHGAQLTVLDAELQQQEYRDLMISIADYQQRNWLLAYAAFRYLAKRDSIARLTAEVLQETQALQVPGRMDIFSIGDQQIIMDGAHNAQKITAFVQSFQNLYPAIRPIVILSLKTGKEYEAVAPVLARLTDHVIVTTFDTSQDLPVHSMSPMVLAKALRQAGIKQVSLAPNHNIALQQLLASGTPLGVVLGSFYLLSQIRQNEVFASAPVTT